LRRYAAQSAYGAMRHKRSQQAKACTLNTCS
jgi:hypothetical protein